ARGDALGLELTHRFTRLDRAKEYAFRFELGPGSPIEPALAYRRWLVERRELVTLAEKIREAPRVERLLGALHAYLWGSGYLRAEDVLDWKGLCRKVQAASGEPADSPAKRLGELLGDEAREAVRQLAAGDPGAGRYQERLIARDLAAAL